MKQEISIERIGPPKVFLLIKIRLSLDVDHDVLLPTIKEGKISQHNLYGGLLY